ncbi:MAG: hypothetical protein ACD_76C00161G0018 [uncultured bacterium]|nr:MAG: hypothetical protein ACD_76C00161G0018 [uncultured bacterium]
MNINVKLCHPDAVMPEYKTAGSVGFDLAVVEEQIIAPNETKFLRTGLIICVPNGYSLILAARGSISKKNLILANGIGVVDTDYCGPNDEILLAVRNIGAEPYTVQKHERLAQGLFMPVEKTEFEKTDAISETSRGGFGSTG